MQVIQTEVALGLQDDVLHSQEESFAAVLLSAVAGRPEADAEADGVLRRALQLARDAGYLQAQAQVMCADEPVTADMGIPGFVLNAIPLHCSGACIAWLDMWLVWMSRCKESLPRTVHHLLYAPQSHRTDATHPSEQSAHEHAHQAWHQCFTTRGSMDESICFMSQCRCTTAWVTTSRPCSATLHLKGILRRPSGPPPSPHPV